jgi:hypothetical protein
MAIDSRHPTYEAGAAKWVKCRDASDGQDAVHAKGKAYLPELKDQTNDDYDAYKSRASYFNATGRTLEGLVGMVFRKEPDFDLPASMEGIRDDIDLNGTSATGLAKHILTQVLDVGRHGILVEYPTVTEQPANLAAAQERNLRPYTSNYCAESIINWRVTRINNVMQPDLVVLSEEHHEPIDEYSSKVIPQIRELRLGEMTRPGGEKLLCYYQQVYQKPEGKDKFVPVGGPIIPMMNSVPLSFIPFYMFGPETNDFTMQDPPLLDLVNLNLAHYRVTADYEHGCHFAGLPTLLLAGIEQIVDDNGKAQPIYVGSQTAIVSSRPEAHGEFIEFQGQGMGALEKNLDRKESQMAAIGARMLAPEKTGVEAEGTLRMRTNGESSVLASMANLVSKGMTDILKFMAEWSGVNVAVSMKLSTDYMPAGMTAQELAELVKAWQSNAISFETMFENLKRGEIISEKKTVDQEKQEIEDGAAPTVE